MPNIVPDPPLNPKQTRRNRAEPALSSFFIRRSFFALLLFLSSFSFDLRRSPLPLPRSSFPFLLFPSFYFLPSFPFLLFPFFFFLPSFSFLLFSFLLFPFFFFFPFLEKSQTADPLPSQQKLHTAEAVDAEERRRPRRGGRGEVSAWGFETRGFTRAKRGARS